MSTSREESNSGEESNTPWDDFLSDFTLVVDSGGRIKCHKLVLAKCSPVFKAMLQTNMVEVKTNQMKMSGFDLETVRLFLEYTYSSKNMSEHDFDIKNFKNVKLLKMAHQYQIKDLEEECIFWMQRNDDIQCALDIWNVGEELDIKELKLSIDSMARLMSATYNIFKKKSL